MKAIPFKLQGPKQRSRGFTLMEVLVALAIIATALGALIKTSGSNTSTLTHLRDKTLAHWVAMNKATELLVTNAWPSSGSTTTDVTKMADREWHWTLKVQSTEDKDIRRFEIEVRHDSKDDNSLLTLTGFLARPSN